MEQKKEALNFEEKIIKAKEILEQLQNTTKSCIYGKFFTKFLIFTIK